VALGLIKLPMFGGGFRVRDQEMVNAGYAALKSSFGVIRSSSAISASSQGRKLDYLALLAVL
jgi:hypothetical protein